MLSREFSRIFPVAIASAIASAVAALLVAAAVLPSLAQTIESGDNMSGTVNSLVQEDGETTYVLGGEWNLSLEGDNLTEFSADLVMTASDGTGSHTHRIVVAEEDLGSVELQGEPSGDVTVTVTPAEQAAGGTVLVNATGLVASNATTVKVGDIIAGSPDSDEEGNVLFALGVTEEMAGSQTVTVEDGVNSGSATFMSTGTEATTESGNLTSPETTGNLTTTEPTLPESSTPTEPSSDQTGESIYGSTIEGDSYDTGTEQNDTSDVTQTSPEVEDTSDLNPEGELTTFEEEAIAAGEVFEDMPGFEEATSADNATSDGTDMTSNQTDTSGVPEGTETTASFEVVADIYTEDELAWEDVSVTISVMNGQLISIEIDPEATENHFGDQPIFGIVE